MKGAALPIKPIPIGSGLSRFFVFPSVCGKISVLVYWYYQNRRF